MPKKHYHQLRKKWQASHKENLKKLHEKHPEVVQHLTNSTKQLAAGSLGGLLLLTSPILPAVIPEKTPEKNDESQIKKIDPRIFLVHDLGSTIPDNFRYLNSDEERIVEETLSRNFNFPVKAELEGKRLNTTYGIIGAEQHLMRYPGDTMASHFDPPAGGREDANKYYSSGMAPGRGAWGYFVGSRSQLTQEDVDREKYYLAVQTFLSKDFNSRVAEYRDFYKFRKMLVVNPHNGKAVVAVIGDAGPAVWTGKHLGGSPEVMKHLERVDGKARGPVLYFFIDDPENKVPLGPIEPYEK